jgi:hypothetical protein
MFNLILANFVVILATLLIAGTGVIGHSAKQTFVKIFSYDGPSSFIKVPFVFVFTFAIAVFPSAFLLMHALGILHLYMPTLFTESYSYYDTLHIDLALTLITAPYVISRRMATHQSRKDYLYE